MGMPEDVKSDRRCNLAGGAGLLHRLLLLALSPSLAVGPRQQQILAGLSRRSLGEEPLGLVREYDVPDRSC
jgi:hypothetical protein